MFNNLYSAANEIRTLLMPFAFVLCVIGIGEMGWRAGSDPRAVLGALIASPLTPIGLARTIEPNAGFALDPAALAIGAIVTFAPPLWL